MIKIVNAACRSEGYNPCSLQLANRDSGKHEVITINKAQATMSNYDTLKVHSSLYIEDKYSISNDAYHEMSMLSNLPSLSEVRKLTKSLDSTFPISNPPNNIIGAQTSLRARISYRLEYFINRNKEEGKATPQMIRIKLTADVTRIACSLDLSTTIIDEGSRA